METSSTPPPSTPETPPVAPETNPPHIPLVVEKKQSHVKMFFLGIVVAIVVIGLLIAGYYLGQKKTDQKPTAMAPVVTPTKAVPNPTVATSLRSSIPLTEDTVSFARVNGVLYLQYRNKIYKEQVDDATEPTIVDIPNANTFNWIGLVNAPKNVDTKTFDEVFSLKSVPGTENFLFVMRWTMPDSEGKIDQTLPVFYYDNSKATVEKINMATEKFPRIKSISEKQYVEFLMFECWNCGGHQPSTELVNLNGNYAKNIGRVSYFAWKNGGNYEYKEYVVIPCPTGIETMGECSEKPEDVPMKIGKL